MHSSYLEKKEEIESGDEFDRLMKLTKKAPPVRKNLAKSFNESDVQILVNNLAISRQEAVDALKYTDGNLELAFKSELGRLQFNRDQILEFCAEYCELRGLSHGSKYSSLHLSHEADRKISKMRKIRELAQQNDVTELIREMLLWDASIPERYPEFYFKLKRCEFLSKTYQGQSEKALRIAREEMAPLTKGSPELTRILKETFSVLISTDIDDDRHQVTDIVRDDVARGLDLTSLVGSLCGIFGEDLELNRSKLILLLNLLLEVHSKWLETQMMRDPFEAILWIPKLKRPEPEQESSPGQDGSELDTAEGQTTMDLSNQPNESSILTIMEVLAFNRVEAINLLHQYNGDLDAIFQSLLS
jgi:hypothetical protein